MKVAVFTSRDEVIILAVKGRGRSVDDVDGYDQWFKDTGRDVREYTINLGHVGAGSAIQITTYIKSEVDRQFDIQDWFYCTSCGELTCTCDDDSK